ncbi:MAG: SMI1/KNR4 family protein [Ruminococcus sp.]|jgi:hypothetical protein|nr:SMI1/KNR4 family protein [Ruminococcus sp.]
MNKFIYPQAFSKLLSYCEFTEEGNYLYIDGVAAIFYSLEKAMNYEYEEWSRKDIFPFSKNIAGDNYVWLNEKNEKGEYPVYLCYYDDVEVIYVANSFEDFVFRQMLEEITEDDESIHLPIDFETAKTIIKKMVGKWIIVANEIFPPAKIEVIENLMQKDIVIRKSNDSRLPDAYFLLTQEESIKILISCGCLPLLGENIKWTVE